MSKLLNIIKMLALIIMYTMVCATVVMFCIWMMAIIYKLIIQTGVISDAVYYLKNAVK